MTESQLSLLHESTVQESEIDSLGHMNVRFYVERAAAANQKLLRNLGIEPREGETLRRSDTYNRFHREQFAGANLHTLGGLIATENRNGVTGYYEIRNADSNDIAATFILTSEVVNADTFIPREVSPTTDAYIELPDYGRPRSLSLNPPTQPTYDEIDPLVPDDDQPGNMSGRREGVVLAEDCDESGRLREDKDIMSVMWRPQPGEDLRKMGPPHLRDALGRLYSWAMMEIRNVTYDRPHEGETVISMSADVDYGDKWRVSRRWFFAKETKKLLAISDHTALCMDLEARRAIEIPDEIREIIEQNCLRKFA